MPRLTDLQQQFSDYLLSRNDDIAACIVDDKRLSKQTRLEIYKNAYAIRLTKCIETDHPMLGKYLGDELFETMATGYIHNHPSQTTSLRNYCDNLPGYLRQTEPFSLSLSLSLSLSHSHAHTYIDHTHIEGEI